MRHTRGHSGNRRSHHALKNQVVVADKESGNLRLPHRLDEVSGMYRGKKIAAPKPIQISKKQRGAGPMPLMGKSHVHEGAHAEHANADAKGSAGVKGKVASAGRPKARSGFGGGV